MPKTNRIVIRCDGAPEIGLGHVVRCLALADELLSNHGCEIIFAMVQGPLGYAQVATKGYEVLHPPMQADGQCDEDSWLQDLMTKTQAQTLVLDVRTDLAVDTVQRIRDQGVLIATIDDPSDRRLASDLAFYPPVPQVERLDWRGFTGKRYVGWEWVLLRPEFAEAARRRDHIKRQALDEKHHSDQPLTLLVTMGGSDPAGFTLMALKAIDQLEGDFRTLVVIGSGFMQEAALDDWLATAKRHYELHRDVSDMPTLMCEADVAVASFGVTAYELAVMRVPTVYLCLTEDHAESASAFSDAKMALTLGSYHFFASQDIAYAVTYLFANSEKRKKMSQQTIKKGLDGLGLARIAKRLVSNCLRKAD